MVVLATHGLGSLQLALAAEADPREAVSGALERGANRPLRRPRPPPLRSFGPLVEARTKARQLLLRLPTGRRLGVRLTDRRSQRRQLQFSELKLQVEHSLLSERLP